jgi:hypothetical protein
MLTFGRFGCFLAGLIAASAVTAVDAKVLRNKNKAPTVWVFKDADALRRFNQLGSTAPYSESVIESLLTCKAPQGSKIVVLARGYRTAFVRVVEGSANGCGVLFPSLS